MSPPAPELFSATLQRGDPGSTARFAASTGIVLGGGVFLVAVPTLLAAVLTLLTPARAAPDPSVWLHLDEDPGPVFAYYEDAPLVLSLAPPEPVTPTPRGLEDATATDATGTDIDPEPEIEPEPETAPETETETKPETETEPETESDGETETAETESESDGEPEPDTETESPAPAGTPDPSGSPLITERTEPTRRTGTSPELAPGEMATCLVRAEGKGWHVQGCATGLHRDAISLAREVRSAQLVLVTLKGA